MAAVSSTAAAISPMAGRDAASVAQALRAELAASAGQEFGVDLPDSATTFVKVALVAGPCLTDSGLLLLSPSSHHRTLYAPFQTGR
jgi:hypothetical protein